MMPQEINHKINTSPLSNTLIQNKMVISIQIESDNHVSATDLLYLVNTVTTSMINNCNLSSNQTAKGESEKGKYQIQLVNDQHN